MRTDSTALRSLLAAALLAAGSALVAQPRDQYGTPAGYEPVRDETRQTVARISDFDGRVSYSRGDDPDDWQPASRNVPVTLGDRLYTDARSRVELQVHGGAYVRLGSRTDLAVLNLTDDTKQFAVKSGVASFRIRRLDEYEVFEVDTPNAAVTFERPGDYRVDVDLDGNTRVTVRDGRAEVAAGGGYLSLEGREAVQIYGLDNPQYDYVAIGPADGWDRWVSQREARIERARSYEYVSGEIVGVDDLDEYGRWERTPSYGWVWTPTVVAAGWVPYRVGQWIWQDPWGWTWVSAEPWGWAPYHYGRWVFLSSRWCWVPVARSVRYVTYSPALVAFVGGGPGWSASFLVGGGFVGWFPLAPRDPFIPWWGPRVSVQVTNVTYVNRTYATVVDRRSFVSGGIVTSNLVRDRTVIREVTSAPVLRGPLPLVPTREAIRVASRPGAVALRPPAAVLARPVVARIAPPPAPPSFQRKLDFIRENRGAPVAPAVAAEVAVQDRRRPESITAVRPVASETGRVTLAPRGQAASSGKAPRVEPVAPVRGRPMATAERPVASAPVVAPRESSARSGQERDEAAPREARPPDATPRTESRPQPAVAAPRERPAPAPADDQRQPTASARERQPQPPARERREPAPAEDQRQPASRARETQPPSPAVAPRERPAPAPAESEPQPAARGREAPPREATARPDQGERSREREASPRPTVQQPRPAATERKPPPPEERAAERGRQSQERQSEADRKAATKPAKQKEKEKKTPTPVQEDRDR